MNCKRIVSLVLAVLVFVCCLSPLSVLGKKASGFSGNRTLEFTFDSSDLDNYANGGRSGVDFYLRRSAPEWLSYSLRGKGQNVLLRYSFDFGSYEEYFQKIATLLSYRPDILYKNDGGLILVESFDGSHLLGSLQQALGQSQELFQWAKVTEDTLTLDGKSYDFSGQKVYICPENGWEIPLKDLEITTSQEKNALVRTITFTIRDSYTEHHAWKALVRRCKKIGEVKEEEWSSTLVLEVTFKASNQYGLTEKTSACLDMPVGLSAQLSKVDDGGCTYLQSETFLLQGYLEEYGSFRYKYTVAPDVKNVSAISDDTDVYTDSEEVDGELVEFTCIDAEDQSSISFRYTAPFRFEQLNVHTEWSSVFRKIHRTITLTAPLSAAQVYHETIKEELSERLVRGATLEIYDQDQTRYYVLTFSSWFWMDVAGFTDAILKTKITHQDSWIPMGQSSYEEKLGSINVLKDFGAAYSVRVSYNFPGSDMAGEGGSLEKGVLVFTDTTEDLQIEYRHLHFIKLLVLLLGAFVISLTVVKLVKKISRKLKAKFTKRKTAKENGALPKQSCANSDAVLDSQDTVCPDSGDSCE